MILIKVWRSLKKMWFTSCSINQITSFSLSIPILIHVKGSMSICPHRLPKNWMQKRGGERWCVGQPQLRNESPIKRLTDHWIQLVIPASLLYQAYKILRWNRSIQTGPIKKVIVTHWEIDVKISMGRVPSKITAQWTTYVSPAAVHHQDNQMLFGWNGNEPISRMTQRRYTRCGIRDLETHPPTYHTAQYIHLIYMRQANHADPISECNISGDI